MNDLLKKLESFDIDGGPSASTFAMRLAKEQGWSTEYTGRVIREYKRFIYLGATAGPVSPSEIVDEVWHLHMIYTESYWDRMCGQILGKPFHHHPSRGGQSEDVKHRDMFAETLTKYRLAFGEDPPADIWRAKKAAKPTPVEAWVIDKRSAGRWGLVTLILATLPLVIAGCTDEGVPAGLGIVICLVPIVIIAIVGVAIAQRRGGSRSSCSGSHDNFGAHCGVTSSSYLSHTHDHSQGQEQGGEGQGHCSGGGHCSSGDSGSGDSGGSSCGGGGCSSSSGGD
jgi:hypothetical protein